MNMNDKSPSNKAGTGAACLEIRNQDRNEYQLSFLGGKKGIGSGWQSPELELQAEPFHCSTLVSPTW